MRRHLLFWALCLCLTHVGAQSIVVAPFDAPAEAKKRADIVCDGKADEVKLRASLDKAGRYKVIVDTDPRSQREIECLGRHSVLWLPGTYNLSRTLVIPDMADSVIEAEGTFFDYQPAEGDAVLITGMNRCRYNLGTIRTGASGAAIHVQPTEKMSALMSFVTFTGLIGKNQKGIGLDLDHRYENICVMNFVGTDVYGFDTGVLVDDQTARQGVNRPTVKSDTNLYWFSYIRMCHTCIWEKAAGIDCGHWTVNVDASIPGSTAIRTAGEYSTWDIIMGTFSLKDTRAFVLEPGAEHQFIHMVPPIDVFRWQDHSGNKTNVHLSTSRLPLRDAPRAELMGYWNRAGNPPGHEARRKELEAQFGPKPTDKAGQ